MADLGAIIRQHRKWTRLLPRVVRALFAPCVVCICICCVMCVCNGVRSGWVGDRM